MDSPSSSGWLDRRRLIGTAAGAFLLCASGQRSAYAQSVELRAKAVDAKTGGAPLALAFGGAVPGPELRIQRGKPLQLTIANDLSAPIALSWPGLRGIGSELPPRAIPPGQQVATTITPRDAGTFWYRAFTPSQSAAGLFGLLVVEDGVAVDREASLVLSTRDGKDILANGWPQAEIAVRPGERVRFRILNASPATMMAVRFDRHEAIVVALDGQPAEPFAARDARILLAPGNRADVMIDMTAQANTTLPVVVETPAGAAESLLLRYGSEPIRRSTPLPPPTALPANPLPQQMDFGRSVRAELPLEPTATRVPDLRRPAQRPVKLWGSMEPLDLPGPTLIAKTGQTVMLALKNNRAAPQAVHIGGHPFRLLDTLDDGWKPYWLDTVVTSPQRTTRIAFVAEPGRWPIVCQPLQTGDPPTIGWFQID